MRCFKTVLAEQDAAGNACGLRGLHVAFLVAEQNALRQIDGHLFGGSQNHAGLRLAAGTSDLVLAERFFRMVRAEVDAGQRGSCFLKHPTHVDVERLEIGLRVVAAADARLVGHDHERVARFVKLASGVQNNFNPLEILATAHVGVIDVDHAVAIEKSGFAHRQARSPVG